MARPIRPLELTQQQRQELRALINRPTAPQRLVRRARIIQDRADGFSQVQTAERVGANRPVLSHWEKRFRAQGLGGLEETKRSGRKPSLDPKIKEKIITEATRPPHARKRWSLRSMAKTKGVAPSPVHRLWRAHDIKPHLVRTL